MNKEKKLWRVVDCRDETREVIVIPDDGFRHKESLDCECNPSFEFFESGNVMVVHNINGGMYD
jgi:hypothetical protein